MNFRGNKPKVHTSRANFIWNGAMYRWLSSRLHKNNFLLGLDQSSHNAYGLKIKQIESQCLQLTAIMYVKKIAMQLLEVVLIRSAYAKSCYAIWCASNFSSMKMNRMSFKFFINCILCLKWTPKRNSMEIYSCSCLYRHFKTFLKWHSCKSAFRIYCQVRTDISFSLHLYNCTHKEYRSNID